MDALNNFIGAALGVIWSPWLVYLSLAVAVILSIVFGFPQIVHLKTMVKSLFGGKNSEKGISSFQAFSLSLGGRVGTGNIAGVATAIFYGGPGAVFWMWVYAILGAATAILECGLSQVFKFYAAGKEGQEYRGGSIYYTGNVRIGGKRLGWLGGLLSVIGLFGFVVTGPSVQSFTIADSMLTVFNIPMWLTGIVIAILFALIVYGGVRRMADFSQKVVPAMAGIYLLLALVIILVNITKVPAVFALIFSSAFNPKSMFGGLIGVAFLQGVQRAVYSTEAGWGGGSGPAAATEVPHPIKQGLAQGFSVYIDTIGVCTASALMILMTGMYQVGGTDNPHVIAMGFNAIDPNIGPGSGYVQEAVSSILGQGGRIFVAIAVLFFAFTTLVAFGYGCIVNISYWFQGKDKALKIAMLVGGLLQTASVFWGCVQQASTAWALADIGVGAAAWVNLVVLIYYIPLGIKLNKDFWKQKKAGLEPVFEPSDIGLGDGSGADIWYSIIQEKYADLLAAKRKAFPKA
jgi:AGCS family alanine or glycine:cation symporter